MWKLEIKERIGQFIPGQPRRVADHLQGDAACGEVCAAEGGEGCYWYP